MATVGEVKSALEEHVGQALKPKIWGLMVRREWHIPATQEEPGEYSFIAAIESLAGDYCDLAGLGDWRENLRQAGTREIPADDRIDALAEILALDAERLPAVIDFRQRHLPDGLLEADSVADWVRARTLDHAQPNDGFLEFIAGDEYHPDMGNYAGGLDDIHDPEPHVQREWVSRDSALWELRGLSRGLSLRSGWSRATATNFVLTGAAPAPAKAIAWTRRRLPFEALTRIVIEVDPRVTPAEVRRLYGELRRELRGGGDQQMTEKHIQLALFAARDGTRLPRGVGLDMESLTYHGRDRRSQLRLGMIAPDTYGQGPPWPEIQKRWNKLHPEWAYDDVRARRFSRDVRNAWKRVTGQPWWVPLSAKEAEDKEQAT